MKARVYRQAYKVFLIFLLFLILSCSLLAAFPAQASRSFTASLTNQDIINNNQLQYRDLEVNYFPQDIILTKDDPTIRIEIIIRNRNPLYQIDNVFLRIDDEKYISWFNGWPYAFWSLYPGEEKSFEVILSIPGSIKEPEDIHEIVVVGDYAGRFRTPRTIKVKVIPTTQWFRDVIININDLPAEFKELNPGDKRSLDSVRTYLRSTINTVIKDEIPLNFSRIRQFLSGSLLIIHDLTAAEQSFKQGKFSQAGQELDDVSERFPNLQKYIEWEHRPEYKEPSKQIFTALERINNAAQETYRTRVEITLMRDAERLKEEALREENTAKGQGVLLFESIAHYQNARNLYQKASDVFSISRKEINKNMARTLRERAISLETETLSIKKRIDNLRGLANNDYKQAMETKNRVAAFRNLSQSLDLYAEAVELFRKALAELIQIGDKRDLDIIQEITNGIFETEEEIAKVREQIQEERDNAVKNDLEGDKNANSPSELKMAAKLESFSMAQKYYKEAIASFVKSGSPEDIGKAEIIRSKLEDIRNKDEALDREIRNRREVAQEHREEALKAQNSAKVEERLPSRRSFLVSAINHSNLEIDIYSELSNKPEDLNLLKEARARADILEKEIKVLDQQVEQISYQSAAMLQSVEESLRLSKIILLWPLAKSNFEEAKGQLALASSYLNKIGEADKTEDYNRYLTKFPEVKAFMEITLVSNLIILVILAMSIIFLSMRYFNLESVRRERDLERSLFQ